MSTTPRALGRAKALTAGTMLAAAVATGGVAVHLADAQPTASAAGSTGSDESGTSAVTSGTSDDDSGSSAGSSSDDSPSSDDSESESDDDSSSSSSSSGSSGTTSNGFSQPGPVAPAQAPAQSSTNGS